MKLILLNSENINFTCKGDLAKAIPKNTIGKVLNYGQGEGQVEISNTVWGFYKNSDNNNYYIQLEEGAIEWDALLVLVINIIDELNSNFSCAINVIAEGPYKNGPNI